MVSVLINGNTPFTWQKKKNTWDALHFNIVCGHISLPTELVFLLL